MDFHAISTGERYRVKVDRCAMDDWRFRNSALNLGFPYVLNCMEVGLQAITTSLTAQTTTMVTLRVDIAVGPDGPNPEWMICFSAAGHSTGFQ